MRISRKACQDQWDEDCLDIKACREPETWDADCLPPRLRERIRAMAKADVRNFASAMARLLDLGLEVWEEEPRVLRRPYVRPGAGSGPGRIIPFPVKH